MLQELRTCAAARPAHIVLSEGHDPRIVAGALDAVNAGIARVTLVGATFEVQAGLAKPANDLSRGCMAEDVTNMIAVTVLQAGHG